MANPLHDKLTRRALMGGGAVVVAVGGGAFALRGNQERGRHPTGDAHTLNRGNGAEPDTLDPHKASADWENNIIGDMFIGLMTESAGADPVPGAALSYTASADGLTYTFKLRDHVWSDGVPVTAHDFVYSFRRILDPKTAAQYASILYPIKNAEAVNGGKLPPGAVGVRALDDLTLAMDFEFQVPYLPQLLAHYTTFPVPRHVVEKYGDDWLAPEHIAVNGPFVLKEWLPNDHIRLAKNPRFYDAASVAIDTVNFYPTQDAAAALKRFRAGEFDLITDSIPPQQVDWLRENMSRDLRLWPYIATQYAVFNVNRKPFTDARVRTAVAMAIDREVLTRRVMRAGERPAYAMVPPGMPGYPGKARFAFEAMPMAARIEKAQELLAQAGYGPDNPLTFDFNSQNTTETRIISVALQEMWRQIGAQVRIVSSESQIHYNLLRKHDFALGWAGWSADYRDPKNYLMLFESSSKDLNSGSYSNPKFDALVAKSNYTGDPKARFALLQEAEQTLLDDAGVAPVFYGVTRDLVSTQVKGWVSNNVNINRSRYLSLDRSITAV